jgi:hypothetical protein
MDKIQLFVYHVQTKHIYKEQHALKIVLQTVYHVHLKLFVPNAQVDILLLQIVYLDLKEFLVYNVLQVVVTVHQVNQMFALVVVMVLI